MADPRIIGFYSGIEPDHRGRYLHEIQHWADDQLEEVHDFIQWLFPLPEPSGFNAAAPILTGDSIRAFRARPALQENLRVSFLRMLSFYGLELRSGEQISVTRSPNFETTSAGWLSAGNHNHLRITRILRCLILLGLESEAKAFANCLSQIYKAEQNKPRPAISEETMRFWSRAVGDAGIRLAGGQEVKTGAHT
jgi:hypothetical protein